MTVFGLTGNIGSGKSTVGRILAEAGFFHIDADQVGHFVVEPGQPANKKLQKIFGMDFFDAEERLQRKKLGAYVFSNKEALQQLNSVTHPAINDEIIKRITESQKCEPNRHIVLEAALLLEAGMESLVESVILVAAADDIRLRRVMERDGLSEKLVKDRMNNQMSQQKKAEKAAYVIENNGDLQDLRQAAAEFLKLI
ncbi:MAG: dephospho-CoA kinase [Bacillota bacterium]|jgi:dephospho-CoA kinase